MSRVRSSGTILAALVGIGMGYSVSEAVAQAASCGDLQGQLMQRKSIAEKLSAGGNKKMDPKTACAGFNQLVQNGNVLIKWVDANKDWCQVPDSFVESIKNDHNKAQTIRTRACGFAAKQLEMEKQAKSGGGSGGGLLGGGGLTGSSTLPQGAL